eukprot:Gb_38101 [translate_table: standard]
MEILLADMREESRQIDVKTFAHVTERFVRAGRDQEAVGLFKRLEEFKCQKDEGVLRMVVCALCEKGFARKAEILVKHMRKKLPPDEFIYNTLVRGWCVVGKANEARVMNDMRTLGFSPGLIAYNSLLHFICKSFAQKNPFWLLHEANDLMAEMEDNCISPNQITFNTLIAYLCKIRKTEDAYSKFLRMEKCGCSPNSVTYVLLIKTMYWTARLEDGDKMLDKMIEAGFKPDAKTYYSFIAVLCGIEKVNHALRLLTRMKEDGCEANSKVFDLLILKLSRSGHFDEAQHIWNEATQKGITLDSSPDLLDPRTTKIYKPVRRSSSRKIMTRK